MQIVTVVGARPQFVKAAVVSPALRAVGVDERILDTGQHYDPAMSSVFFDELEIPAPTWSLGVGSGPHGRQTGAMLDGIEAVLVEQQPDLVLIYGDTNSTLAGALAAAKLHIPIAHVEAGLRSFNRRMPEEINRIVADHVSAIHFAPTSTAIENLRAEGISGPGVHDVGDVMYDLAVRAAALADRSTVLTDHGIEPGRFILATVHRAENTDDPERFGVIVAALAEASQRHPVVWPVHPRVQEALAAARLPSTVQLIDPVGYLDMVQLERSAALVVTDSGGVQKEAFFHGRSCVIVRDETEWVELVDLGWNHVSPPTSTASILDSIERALTTTGQDARPYGDGAAGEAIADVIRGLAG